MLADAAAGRFPAADGGVDVLAPDTGGGRAVVALTGHAYVLAAVDPAALAARGADGFGGAVHPDVLRWIAGPAAGIGTLDVVLTRRGAGPASGPAAPPAPTVSRRDDLAHHPRVARAVAHRRDVRVYGDDAGLVVIGRGLVGRWEMAVELFHPVAGGRGHGRRLIGAGLATVPSGEWCWAQVAAGNAASLRAFLAGGFVPVGAEVLIEPADQRSTNTT